MLRLFLSRVNRLHSPVYQIGDIDLASLAKLSLLLFLTVCCVVEASADNYGARVAPYVQKYCAECHNDMVHKGELDLTRYATDNDVTAEHRRWNNVLEFIRNGEMPPEEAKQPSIDESDRVVAAVDEILLTEAIRHAGDPGVVLPRRLSNTEYDLAIRDLTGVDIRPTRDFPADPAGGEGFDNTGESLGTSPSLVKKYLASAQHVADHLVLKPDGISFAPFPVTSYNERKKLTELAIIRFYENHIVDIETYLEAAWRYRYRSENQSDVTVDRWAADCGLSGKYLNLVWRTLSDPKPRRGFLSDLAVAWEYIPAPVGNSQRPPEFKTLVQMVDVGRRVLGAPQRRLIKSNAGNWPISHLDFRTREAAARDQFDRSTMCGETLLEVVKVSKLKDRSDAKSYSVFLRVDPWFGNDGSYVLVKSPMFSLSNALPKKKDDQNRDKVQSLRSVLDRWNPELVEELGFGRHPLGHSIDPEWFVVKAPAIIEIPLTPDMQQELQGKHLLLPCQLDPEHSREFSVFVQHSVREAPRFRTGRNLEYLVHRDSEVAKELAESSVVFCDTFPNRFFYVDNGRGLAAGFHLVEGFFRDDRPLVQKVLSEDENAELNRLWRELEFVTQSAETLLRGFVWFERSEREVLHDKRFDFLRPEDPQLVETSLLDRFEKVYLDKMGIRRIGDTLQAESPDQKYEMIHGFFNGIRDGLKRQQQTLVQSEQQALSQLKQLAGRAYRRPISAADLASFDSLYRTLRAEGQSVEAALRGVLVAILMSPDFCYQWRDAPQGEGVYPLDDFDLASRLSFFLWSSVPDDRLLAVAREGRLQDDDELIAQTRRMLQDPRIESFAREFFGQWLRYRDYLSKDPIVAESFPDYTDALREAMFREPTELATHLIQQDLPVTELLTSDMTFVNGPLAKHYGGELQRQFQQSAREQNDQQWHAVRGLRAQGRGGLFGMAVILTKNSAGERTSPVKRGFWSVHHLLGKHFPPPPADVPELPASETGAANTIRELLAAHVSDSQCAMCHSHFDGLGLAMEAFDAIGKSRTMDRAGRPIDNLAKLPDGTVARGIPELIEYIDQHRRQDFVKTLCRKFLGYALGRSVILSDQPLLSDMETTLQENEFRFSALFESVVRSPQFRQQRGRSYLTSKR